jgi:hypothetical protein
MPWRKHGMSASLLNPTRRHFLQTATAAVASWHLPRSLFGKDTARSFWFIHTDTTLEFQSFLEGVGVEVDLIDLIRSRMGKLNELIRSEKTGLGPGFEIGHSFFCPQETEESLDVDWYRSVIREEIAPLLKEYWFDDPDKAEDLTAQLLA